MFFWTSFAVLYLILRKKGKNILSTIRVLIHTKNGNTVCFDEDTISYLILIEKKNQKHGTIKVLQC